jgi:phosphoesterase RecJ-like protein
METQTPPSVPDGIRDALLQSRELLVTAHDRPDGDALGAAVGLAYILRALGRPAAVVGCQPVPRRYRFLLGGMLVGPVAQEPPPGAALVILDCGSRERSEAGRRWGPEKGTLVNIDHHHSNSRFGTHNWVDPAASSCAEMVWRLARRAGWPVPREAAEALWAGLATDTGSFSYENTSAAALAAAQDLVRCGANPGRLGEALFRREPWGAVQLRRRALESLQSGWGGRAAWIALSAADFEAAGCAPHDAGDLVDLPRNIENVALALFFYEVPAAGETKVSIRAAEPLDATELAGRFGGGGHQRAAGCSLAAPLAATRDRVLAAAAELWAEELGPRREAAAGASAEE